MRKNSVYLRTTPLKRALEMWRQRLEELGLWSPMEAEDIEVARSLGRVTAEAVSAKLSSPFYHCSAMDGYAINFTDSFGATEPSPKRLEIGSRAIYVDTGDPMPEADSNADTHADQKPFNAVIMIEDVNIVDGHIEFTTPATPWQNVRTVGEDIVATELIAPENHVIRPVDMGAMLAGGLTHIPVRRSPRVAIIPTGTEMVEPGSPLKRGSIIEFSSRVLGGLVTQWGGEPVRMDIVPDDPHRIREAILSAASQADMVAVIAGASAGTEDYTEGAISELGELILHGLDIKPGKPAMIGIVKGRPVIGLPGYPVASHLCFNHFARPVIRRWLGQQDTGMGQATVRATLSRQTASSLGQQETLRVKVGKVGGNLIATPLGRGAGLMMSLVRADGFLTIEAASEGLPGGGEVDIELVRPLQEIENTVVSIGSHDNTMDVLANFIKKRHPRYSLSSAHVGSMGGIMALRKNEAHMAPIHLLDEESGEYNAPFLQRLLPDQKITLINLVHRTQGLMIQRGNPRGIKGLEDLRRSDISFINRQRGAGTRLLLDKTLAELCISPQEVNGYDREEYTHMSVASAVLSSVADTGLGILSAANALGLDFIPVARERYDLAVPTDLMQSDPVATALDIIVNDNEFKEAVSAMGGYDTSDMGRVIYEQRGREGTRIE